MSKTHRSDSPLIAGYHHSGDRGLGVRGADVPSSGISGSGILYSGLSLPAEADNEFRVVLTYIPPGLTIAVDEDSSFVAYAADGTYVCTYSAYKDGVLYGTSTLTLVFGEGELTEVTASNGARLSLSRRPRYYTRIRGRVVTGSYEELQRLAIQAATEAVEGAKDPAAIEAPSAIKVKVTRQAVRDAPEPKAVVEEAKQATQAISDVYRQAFEDALQRRLKEEEEDEESILMLL